MRDTSRRRLRALVVNDLTVGELLLVVAGATFGAWRLGSMIAAGLLRERVSPIMLCALCGASVIAPLLLAGSLVALVRWFRGFTSGWGLRTCAVTGALALPYAVYPWFLGVAPGGGEIGGMLFIVFGAIVCPWHGLMAMVVVAGTVMYVRRRDGALADLAGLVLSWLWVGCLAAAWVV